SPCRSSLGVGCSRTSRLCNVVHRPYLHWLRRVRPNNSFKPNLLRYTKAMAERACHGFGSPTQVGLTQALGLMSSAWSISKLGPYSLLAQAALMLVATLAAGFKLFLLFLLALQLSLLGGLVSFV